MCRLAQTLGLTTTCISALKSMGQIVKFPSLPSRKWAEWEREIRSAARNRELPEEVIEDAFPRLRGHWEAIFEVIALELPERAVPGHLSTQQANAIQGITDGAANVVLPRMRHERSVTFQRFVAVELALSNATVRKPAPGAA